MAASGISIIGEHARDRMEERNIRRGDLLNALSGATTATFQPDKGRWKSSGGTDRDGDPLDMAIVMENGIVVITVF